MPASRSQMPGGPWLAKVAAGTLTAFCLAVAGFAADGSVAASPQPTVSAEPVTLAVAVPPSPVPTPVPPPPASSTAAPPPPAPPRAFTIAVTGDILTHSPVVRVAQASGATVGLPYDYRPMFADVAPLLSAADLAVCHLETPLSPDGQGLSYFPVFTVPREIADAVAWAGYDACSTASNHSVDGGAAGVTDTLDVLDAAGIPHAGMARTPDEGATPRLLDVNGVTVGHLSYTYGLNGFSLPAGKPWLVDLIDADRILAEARAARAAGAEFVLVSVHWGEQYLTAPTEQQSALAHQLLAAPEVDLIAGHHAHVVQPVERIGDKWVAYGLGNFLSNQSGRCCAAGTQDGVIVRFTVAERDGRFVVAGARYEPTWVEPGTYRIVPVLAALADPATPPGLRAALEASRARTADAIGMLGAPATPAVAQFP